MNSFDQFNIKQEIKGFEGEKIKMARILNKQIVVYFFELKDSKVYKDRGTGKCLKLQISVDNEKHIVFTSSTGLIEVIQQIPENGFPFTSTIIQENERFKFT